MMKKLLCLMLAFAMLSVMLAGCAGQDSGAPAAESASAGTEPAKTASTESLSTAPESSAASEASPAQSEAAPAESEAAVIDQTSGTRTVAGEGSPITATVTVYDVSQEFPLFDKPTTLTYMGEATPDTDGNPIEGVCIQKINEMTNINWEYTWLTMTTGTETFNLAMASQDYADVISNVAKYYASGIDAAINDEVIINMEQPIKDYMPNYYSIISATEDRYKSACTDSGILWGIQLVSNPQQGPFNGPLVRKDWLDASGVGDLVTLDDWEQFLTYCVDTYDECGSGALNVGSNGAMSNWMTPSYTILGAFNVGSYDCPWVVIDGKVVYSCMEEGYKEYLQLMNKWYSKGIVYKDFATATGFGSGLSFYSDSGEDIAAISDGFYNSIDDTVEDAVEYDPDFALCAVPYPKLTEDQQLHLRNFSYEVRTDYATCISTACEYVEQVCKYFDYMWTEEGILLVNYGPQGVTWDYNADGAIAFTDEITNKEDYTVKAAFSYYGLFNRAIYNDWQREAIICSEACFDALDIWNSSADMNYALPDVSMTVEEAESYSSAYTDIETYASEMVAQFIMGNLNFESDWDSYVSTIEGMGIADVVNIYQAAYDRFVSR